MEFTISKDKGALAYKGDKVIILDKHHFTEQELWDCLDACIMEWQQRIEIG